MIYTATPYLWEQMLDVPLAQRVAPAPEELVRFAIQYNESTGNASVPAAARPAQDFADDVESAIDTLPLLVKNSLSPRLLGVFFMRGLGSSAVTDVVARANGDIIGSVVAVDIDVFQGRTANGWANWRENTPFAASTEAQLAVAIAEPDHDDRSAALQYVLLHEFGHVLAAGSGLLPDPWKDASTMGEAASYAFLQLGWQIGQDGSITPLAGQDFALREQVRYYTSTPELSAAVLPAIYADLARTGFASLYAATSVHEDFAEAFVTYVHGVLMQKPLRMHMLRDGQAPEQLPPFWGTERSQSRERIFEALLAQASDAPLRHTPGFDATAALLARLDVPAMPFLGLAPFARMSVAGGDLQYVAQYLLNRAGEQEDNAHVWMNLSTACFALGQKETGILIQGQALQMQRSYTITPHGRATRFRLLMLVAAGDLAENMPLDCLLEDSNVELIYYYASADAPLPPELPAHDALLVATSYTGDTEHLIATLEPLLAHWHKPVLNRPQCIVNTERQRASALLHEAPGIAMPPTWEIARDALQAVADGQAMLSDLVGGCAFPVILRPVGSHAGRDLVKVDDASQLPAYLSAVAKPAFYISPFIDYSSEDGQFRKYRVALIAGQPYASHMAISSHWMIHYVNAGMYEDPVKRSEEAAWMDHFAGFAARHRDALHAVWQRSGLDYVCIDCAETAAGELLIFEIDHAMVVHAMDPQDLFPYKQAQMRRVKTGFENLLYGLAPVAPRAP